MLAIVRLIRTMGYNVVFVDDKNIDDSSYTTALQQHGVEVLHGFPRAAKHLHNSGGRYHFVILSRPDTVLRYLPVVRANAIQAEVIYDTVDLHWVRLERALSVSFDSETRKQADFYKKLELLSVSCTDLTLAITAEEKEQLLMERPDSRIEILPNIHEIEPGSKSFSDRHGLMFIGGFWHDPNEDAIVYFADEILPLIVEQLPDVVLYVVGSNMPESIKSLESEHIKPIGFVPDVSGYFESCRVFVSPLRYGAGMKGKVGQSIAFGLPVVTTSIGAEGMLLENGRTALIADTPEEFSAAIVQLYTDKALWKMIASNALQHLEANYSMHSARSRIEEIFSQHPVSPSVDGR